METLLGKRKWNANVRELLSVENVAQVNMQRLLLEQNPEHRDYAPMIRRLLLSHSSDDHPEWPSEQAPLRDEEWISEVMPMRGSHPVRWIAGYFDNALRRIKEVPLDAPDREHGLRWAIHDTVPLVGATMLTNKSGDSMCTKWCSKGVAGVCGGIERECGG